MNRRLFAVLSIILAVLTWLAVSDSLKQKPVESPDKPDLWQTPYSDVPITPISAFHKVHAVGTADVVGEILVAPLTWVALGIISLGLLAWLRRDQLAFLADRFDWLAVAASKSFGFERINDRAIDATQATAEALRVTQPGHLSWNLVGIIGGLVAVLILLTWVA